MSKEYSPPSFYETVIQSPEWRAWVEHNETLEMPEYDLVMTRETGWLSPEHFSAFIRYIVRWYGGMKGTVG